MEKTYLLTGYVVHGKALGRTVGMPTANLEPDNDCILLPDGVYAAVACVKNESYPAVTNVGTRPSVDESEKRTIESYLIGFDGDIYGEYMYLELIEKIREVRKMNSLAEVRAQVAKDIVSAEEILKKRLL